MTNSSFLIGVDKATGKAVVWTGKAGDNFASFQVEDAFQVSREYAKAKMDLFNSWEGPVRWTMIAETSC